MGDLHLGGQRGYNGGREGPRGVGVTPTHTIQSRIAKIDFSAYDGNEDPTKWIHGAEHFFHYQKTREDEKVELASFHFKKEAVQQCQWWFKNQPRITWIDLWTILCVQFRHTEYENFNETLSHISQMGTLSDYLADFERLSNRVES